MRVVVGSFLVRACATTVLAAVTLGLTGCASSGTSTAIAPPSTPAAPPAHNPDAIQHFIDGSIYEQKGEFAQAILEYQEALRAEQDPAIYFAISRSYEELGKHALAIEAGREAVRLAPGNADYHRSLASILLSTKDLDSAIVEYEEVVRLDSTSMESWFNLSRLYQLRSPVKAIDLMQKITDRFGPQWDVLLQLAELSNKLGKFDLAAGALRLMTDIDPGNAELRRSLAQTYVRATDYDHALEEYARLRGKDSSNVEIAAEVAAIHLLQRRNGEADREFDALLAIDTLGIEMRLRIGEQYFAQIEKDSTRVPRVRAIFAAIRDRAPEDWRPYWFLGAIGAVARDDSASAQNFRRVTELASWNADAWVYLSSVFLSKNNYGEVSRVLEGALKVVPDDFRVNFFLGIAYNRLNRNVDAVRVLEHARSINPKDIDAISQLALVYEALKHYGEADSLYEEAIRLDPANPLVLNNYGYSLAERNVQLDRALTMAKKALDAEPENGSYLDTYGWILFRMERYPDAATFVKRAIEKGEANAVVFEHLGDIYFKMNDRSAALEQWKMAQQLDKENASLRDKISRGSL